MNIVLGIATLAFVGVLCWGLAQEAFRRSKVKTEIEADMKRLADDHGFMVPGLGYTMADGGERTDSKGKRPA